MPQVTIADKTFERLQRHARPLVDTLDTVINRAVDRLEQDEDSSERPAGSATETERRIDPRVLPNLTHTKVLDASIEGKLIAKANWNLLLDEMLRGAMNHVGIVRKTPATLSGKHGQGPEGG